jgi:hypothetical protein
VGESTCRLVRSRLVGRERLARDLLGVESDRRHVLAWNRFTGGEFVEVVGGRADVMRATDDPEGELGAEELPRERVEHADVGRRRGRTVDELEGVSWHGQGSTMMS